MKGLRSIAMILAFQLGFVGASFADIEPGYYIDYGGPNIFYQNSSGTPEKFDVPYVYTDAGGSARYAFNGAALPGFLSDYLEVTCPQCAGGLAGGAIDVNESYGFKVTGGGSTPIPIDVSFKVIFYEGNLFTNSAATIEISNLSFSDFASKTLSDQFGNNESGVYTLQLDIVPNETYIVGMYTNTEIDDGFYTLMYSGEIFQGSSSVDPYIYVDPSFAKTDPNYLSDYTVDVEGGVPNGFAIPEPASWALFIAGTFLLGAGLRLKRVPSLVG
jgi:hypothetical protein